MKFCIGCGAQIDDNANACPVCGAMQGGGAQQAAGAPAYQAANAYAPAKSGFRVSIGGIVAAVGYVIMLISLFVPILSVREWGGTSAGVSLRQATTAGSILGEPGMGWLFYVPLIFVLLGLVCALVSMLTRNKVLLLIVTILEVLFAALVIIVIAMVKSEHSSGAGLGAGFFLWIIGIVVALVGMIMDYAGKRKG